MARRSSADVCLLPEEGPRGSERLPRPLEVAKPRFRERLLELDRPLDGVLDRPMRRVERGDGVVLGAAEDGLHLADGAFENAAARQTMRDELALRSHDSVLLASHLLSKLRDDGAGVELADFAAESVAEGFRRLDELLEFDALLRTKRRLPEEVVVRESVAGLDAGSRVNRLPLAGGFDLSGTQQRENQQPNYLEVPAEGLLRELVDEEPPARRVAVVGTFLNPTEHLRQRRAFNPEDRLTLLVAQEPEATEDRRESLKVLGGEQRVDALLHVVGLEPPLP